MYNLEDMENYYKVNDRVNGYLVRKIIGEGRYGIAYLVTNDQNEQYVLKQIKKSRIKRPMKIYSMRKNITKSGLFMFSKIYF